MSLGLNYKNQEHVFDEIEADTPFLEYPLFQNTGMIKHGFSTRLGGVSEGCWSSLNLSFTRGDKEENVRENFRRIGASIGVQCCDMVFSQQTHTTNVQAVTEDDRGNGMTKPLTYTDVDGLVTNVPGICLVTFYADCVPLFFVDPVRRVIGLSHSGWRGTVGKIGLHTVRLMQEKYGSNPSDILAAIGPSICQDCYEVSEEVCDKFRMDFDEQYWEQLFYQKNAEQKQKGKYQLDLWKANELIFKEAGILAEHIAVTNVCTHCNSRILYSHRTTGDRRGNLAAFLALKQEVEL